MGFLSGGIQVVRLVTVFLRFLRRNSISTQREARNVSGMYLLTNTPPQLILCNNLNCTNRMKGQTYKEQKLAIVVQRI